MHDLHNPEGLKAARQALGFSLRDMAAALELIGPNGPDTVRFWESGKRCPSGPVRVAIRLLLERAGLG